ncbi:MAG: response regulator, partial [Candidatus Yonathbacteria bacterium]|nr:response regulator [Candidatus Yonathbacteria bacterium]
IVEDDEHIAKVYSIKLMREGIASSIAMDGEEAVAKITAEKPDIILLDIILPKKDGFWVLKEIKQDPELANIPVIVLSNLWQQSDHERALVLGANECLVKVDNPIQDIIAKVKKYLGM